MKISMGPNPVSELDTKHGDRPSLRTEEVGLLSLSMNYEEEFLFDVATKNQFSWLYLSNLTRARQLSKHLAPFDLTLSPTTENP